MSVVMEVVVAVLLVVSGIFVVISSIGFLRLKDLFLRLHASALAYAMGGWSVTLASIVHFSSAEEKLVLHPIWIGALLTLTVPVTTLLLARVSLFRSRAAQIPDIPPPLSSVPRSESRDQAELQRQG